jgi:hypothetical protein
VHASKGQEGGKNSKHDQQTEQLFGIHCIPPYYLFLPDVQQEGGSWVVMNWLDWSISV